MPPITATQLVSYFLNRTPDPLLRRVTEIIAAAYPVAFDESRALFSEPVAHDYIGHRRYAIIENGLGAIPALAPDVTASFVPNATGGANHCELGYNGIIATHAKIGSASAAIHEAAFRVLLADLSEPGLFYAPAPPPDGTLLWVCIAHGPGGPRDRTAGFIKAVFPDREGSHEGSPSVDLYARYPDLRPTPRDLPLDTQAEPERQPEPMPRLRPGVIPFRPTGADDE